MRKKCRRLKNNHSLTCQWDEKEETKGKIKKKKARRKEGQISTVKGGGQEEEGSHIYKEEKQKQRAMLTQ